MCVKVPRELKLYNELYDSHTTECRVMNLVGGVWQEKDKIYCVIMHNYEYIKENSIINVHTFFTADLL